MVGGSYPSIISQPGSASRNIEPILDALEHILRPPGVIANSTAHSETSTSDRQPISANTSGQPRRILELASYPYEHIKSYATRFTECEWYGTGRDEWEVGEINKDTQIASIPNLHPPQRLDIGIEEDWASLHRNVEAGHDGLGQFEGIVMINLIHCCPEGLPENIFQNASPSTAHGRKLLDPTTGWIAAYGAFKRDDGSYLSPGDEEFDRTYIRAEHAELGLRTIPSITAMAEKWGFKEELRREMPKGNMWVVWRVAAGS